MTDDELDKLDEQTPAAYTDDDYPEFDTGGASDGGTLQFLGQLARVKPFIDLYNGSPTQNSIFRRICIASDYVIRLLVWALILAVVIFIAWKAIFPLPPIIQGG